MGPGGRWYRLHRLIADVLRTRITDPRTIRDVHRRAAQWYRRHSMPLDAVRYALRGGLWPLAAELVGVHGLALVVRGSARELDVLLSAVARDALLGHPELAATLAAARIFQGSHREVRELVAAAVVGVADLPQPRGERLRVVLDLVEMGHARLLGDLVALGAAAHRVPDDPRTLSALGLAGWDVIPLLVLNNAGTAELWTGDMAEAEKHLRAAMDANQWSGLLRPHLNAASQLALLLGERGDLDAAQADAQAAVQRATEAGWATSAQAVAAYLALAWVSLDRSEPKDVDRWLGRVAEVEAIAPEPHVQLAAAALNALRRADSGDWAGRTHRPAGRDHRADGKCATRTRRPNAAGAGRAAAPDRRPGASGRNPDMAAWPGRRRRPPMLSPACTLRPATQPRRSSRWPPSRRRWAPFVRGWKDTFCAP